MNGRIVRRGLITILALVLAVTGGYAIKTSLDYRAEAQIYEEAQDAFVTIISEEVPLAQLPTVTTDDTDGTDQDTDQDTVQESTEAPAETVVVQEVVWEDPTVPGISVNFGGLTAVNSDIISWLRIPNTPINYPLLQGDSNQTYLETTYDGRYSVVGSIFMDYRNSSDFTDTNTILYGHNVSSGTMFGSLKYYRQASYAANHPHFFLMTEDGYQRYTVCYALVTTSTSFVYDYLFAAEGSYQAHLDSLASQSLYDTGVTVTALDKIVTLSTCTGVTEEERFVVVGKLDYTFPEPPIIVEEPTPEVAEETQTADEAVPTSDETVPTSDETVPTSDETVPTSDETVPTSDETAPTTDNVEPAN